MHKFISHEKSSSPCLHSPCAQHLDVLHQTKTGNSHRESCGRIDVSPRVGDRAFEGTSVGIGRRYLHSLDSQSHEARILSFVHDTASRLVPSPCAGLIAFWRHFQHDRGG